MLADSLNPLIYTPNASYSYRLQWILHPSLNHFPHFPNSTRRNSYGLPNSSNTLLLPTTDCILYSKMMRNFITWSMLSNLSTSPTTVLKKFTFDKNSLFTVSSNSPFTKGSNNELNPLHEKYAEEHILLRPLPGTPQDPLDPIDKILLLYNDMCTSTTHGTYRTMPMLPYGKMQLTKGTMTNLTKLKFTGALQKINLQKKILPSLRVRVHIPTLSFFNLVPLSKIDCLPHFLHLLSHIPLNRAKKILPLTHLNQLASHSRLLAVYLLWMQSTTAGWPLPCRLSQQVAISLLRCPWQHRSLIELGLQSYKGYCVMISHVASWHIHIFFSFFSFSFLI